MTGYAKILTTVYSVVKPDSIQAHTHPKEPHIHREQHTHDHTREELRHHMFTLHSLCGKVNPQGPHPSGNSIHLLDNCISLPLWYHSEHSGHRAQLTGSRRDPAECDQSAWSVHIVSRIGSSVWIGRDKVSKKSTHKTKSVRVSVR